MECIKIWRFDDAPEEYKKLSRYDGDENWVILAFRNEFEREETLGDLDGWSDVDLIVERLKGFESRYDEMKVDGKIARVYILSQ